ncbi:MAG: hypothetical protein IJH79_19240 [Lentisphaeria bacterium]|nr:hypothetical protein [Lentisphaeria bacterium]
MFQQILEYVGSVPFFSSVAFGITAMVIVGSSWCLVELGFLVAAECPLTKPPAGCIFPA